MEESQSDMMFSHNFMNHINQESVSGCGNTNLDVEMQKPKSIGYPSVEGLPKYPLTNQLQYMIKNTIKSMMNHKYASPFLKPVDKKLYKDYYDVVTKPMDLGFIKRKLHGRHYQNSTDCISEFRQMFSNCLTYNKDKDDPEILHMNDELEKHFNSKLLKMPLKEQLLASRGKNPKKNSRNSGSFTSSMNGGNLDDMSSDDDVSHRSGIDERTNSPSVSSACDRQEKRVEESILVDNVDVPRKSVKRKADVLNSSPAKSKSGNNRHVAKRSAKESRTPENAGQDIEIGEATPNISKELKQCFEILRDFFRRPLSVRTSRFFHLERGRNEGDSEEDEYAREELSMDLKTIMRNFHQNQYKEPDQFASDMRRMFTYVYRFSTGPLVDETLEIQNIFEMRFAQVPDTKKKHQSTFNQKVVDMLKTIKQIVKDLESLMEREPPMKKMKSDGAAVSRPVSNVQDNKEATKPRPKQEVNANATSHPQVPIKSPVVSRVSSPMKQAPQGNTEVKLMNKEFSVFFRPENDEKEVTQDELSKLSFVLSKLPQEKLPFLMGLVNAAEPVEDPSKEYELDLEKMKRSTLRAIERYAIHCIGTQEYNEINEHLDKKLPRYAGQYKLPQLPLKTPATSKSLNQHNKNSSLGFINNQELLNLSSSSSCLSSSSSVSLSSPEFTRPASTTSVTSTNIKQSTQQVPAEQNKSMNGDKRFQGNLMFLQPGSNKSSSNNTPISTTNVVKNSDNTKGASKQTSSSESSIKCSSTIINQEIKSLSSQVTSNSSPDVCTSLANKNSTLNKPGEKSIEDKPIQMRTPAPYKDPGSSSGATNDSTTSDEGKSEGGSRFPAWGSLYQKSKSSTSQKTSINPDETFFKFKKQAEEKMEREKLGKQQEEERRQRMELENSERLKKEKELKQAQEEEEALFGARAKPKPPENQPSLPRSTTTSSSAGATPNSHVTSPKNENSMTLSAADRRLLEQEKRKELARSRQIDLNKQSEIFAAFERDIQDVGDVLPPH